ncbi:serine/threonine-protein kinase [Myxosarcina sp. GI1]|uniref:serine/threonine-protein kinase n=1 Tax=Myxosarcina sp. GI1 TaxID=1541065 RepID=UPI00055C60B8|nr:serine/threonine-protein kinase [Myxosarcina sp. GI1]
MKVGLLNNRYRILETLGRGGFGETYLAEDTHMPSKRKCVLKQLKPVVNQPQIPPWMKERFQREAAILEELGEGNSQIPQLYAYFSEADKFYLVQEWIDGLTLEQYWQQEGNLRPEEVRQILLQLLPVLDYVHSRHIIHRDLKPENIILQGKTPFLIDFGAVKEAIVTTVDRHSSIYSAAIGTPGYMPSEQAVGRPVYSSDLYALGLTAIFLLTGKSPQDLDSDPRNGEILWQEHAERVDKELVAIINRAIRLHPRDRFSTAREMLAALRSSGATERVTGATLRVAPAHTGTVGVASENYSHTVGIDVPERRKTQQRSWWAGVLWFVLIAVGVAVGTFSVGFYAVSSLWRSRPEPTSAELEKPDPETETIRFPPLEDLEAKVKTRQPKAKSNRRAEARETELEPESETAAENETEKPEIAKQTKSQPPEVVVNSQPKPEIDVPILTTGTSESQLVSTLGEPTFQEQDRRGQEGSQILVYRDIVPDRVNLSYRSDNKGNIHQTDIALDPELSLGAMQETLAKLLGGEAPAVVKDKLRSVYSRQTDLSSFTVGNRSGQIRRDSKNRVNISVWETGTW